MTMNPNDTAPIDRLAPEDVRVLLLENIHADGAALLRAQGYQVEEIGRALGEDELIEKIGDVHVLGIRSTTYITPRVM